MKKWGKRIVITGLTLFVIFISWNLYTINSLTATETYPEDSYLDKITNKKALIITAHTDDDAGMAGTIAKLTEAGWDIKHICIFEQDDERRNAYLNAANVLNLSGSEFLKMKHRNDLDTNEIPWLPFAIEDFEKVFNTDTFRKAITTLIYKYQPEIIFSMDDSIGVYGNPDHVFISKLVREICETHKDSSDFSVKKIYQGVLTRSMAYAIMVKHSRMPDELNAFLVGQKKYHVTGMPKPDVEVNITEWGSKKKDYFSSYAYADNKNIKKFYKYYHWYPAWLYFRIFDKEYFRVLTIKNTK